MILFHISKYLERLGLRPLSSYIFKLIKKLYSILLILPACFLFVIIRSISLNKKKKIISLRISRDYFGHFAIEPAMASAFLEEKSNKYILFVSFKPSKGIRNAKLEAIAKKTFKLNNDFLMNIVEHIFNRSLPSIKSLIKKYYQPFIPLFDIGRELKYGKYIFSSNTFPWRKHSQEILFKKSNSKEILIALRSHHYNHKKVSPQPWRDLSLTELEKVIEACINIKHKEKLYCLSNKEYITKLSSISKFKNSVIFLDEKNTDVLDIFNENTLLINNGNGIGAAAHAIGIKTFFIQHTFWHLWHTSFSNAVILPSEFRKNNNLNKTSINEVISLAFSPKSPMPLNIVENYFKQGLSIKSVSEIPINTVEETLKQCLILESYKKKRKSNNFLGCEFSYSSEKEKEFWKLYISNLPLEIRHFHKKISLHISESYLNNFI